MFKTSYEASEKKLIGKNVDKNKYDDALLKSAINYYFSKMNLDGFGRNIGSSKNNKDISKKLVDKWGSNYDYSEYQQLENYFDELSGYFEIEDPVQKNLIKLAVMTSVSAEKALSEKKFEDYKKLQSIYSSILSDSRLKPSQKTSADSIGLATVGQWVEKIELIEGRIPAYEIRDLDKIDKTIELYIEKMKENLNITCNVSEV